jgi:SSS family solute:Na+ symporter
MIDTVAITVFGAVSLVVITLGFAAVRWYAGDLKRLQEWGLAGKRFGTIISWFLLGGDIYTTYSFIAVPALVFSAGVLGFYAIPYGLLIYPLAFFFLPRFWVVARHRGYLTPADFARERFGSSILALLVAVTGILATMPYIALQIYGIQISLAQMGVPLEVSLLIAFTLLAAYTYVSGLRASALIAVVKGICIWIVMLVAIIYIPMKLGGYPALLAAAHQKALATPAFHDTLSPSAYSTFTTLILGSALALFLYPHTLTGMLSTNSSKVIRRNCILLVAYTILIAFLALLGYAAIAANISPSPVYGANAALPQLFSSMFPSWFTGFAFASIAIGALVPAAVMSIAAANLFTRNMYREYFRPNCSDQEESRVAKVASLVIKFGALAFMLLLPSSLIINYQLLSNIWIIQTLPVIFLGLYTNWFHRWALITGMVGGLILGTWMVMVQNFASSIYPLKLGSMILPVYVAVIALMLNLLLSIVLTFVYKSLGIPRGEDATSPADYQVHPASKKYPSRDLLRQIVNTPSMNGISWAPSVPNVATKSGVLSGHPMLREEE